MNDYFLRCQQSEVPALMAMGVALGLLIPVTDDDGVATGAYAATAGNALDVIGEVLRPTGATQTIAMDGGATITVPVQAPVLDSMGTPYWHANLRTSVALTGAALQSMSAWFTGDVNGRPVAPEMPARVWF